MAYDYVQFRENLIKRFAREKDRIYIKNSQQEPDVTPLFEIYTDDEKFYMKVVGEFRYISTLQTINLLTELFRSYGIELFKGPKMKVDDLDSKLYWDALEDSENNDIKGQNLNSYSMFDIVAKIDGENKFIEVNSNLAHFDKTKIDNLTAMVEQSKLNGYVVFLAKDNIGSRREIDYFNKRMNARGIYGVEGYTFESFLEKIFGIKERKLFQDSMINFDKEMHQEVGYQLTELCSPYNLEKLKETLKKEIPGYNYDSIWQLQYSKIMEGLRQVDNHDTFDAEEIENLNNALDFDESDYEIIKKVYIDQGRYKLLLGNNDFAKSFLSSEWIYRKYSLGDELDNTFVVTGYLKSIEQLLWDIVYMIGPGRSYHKSRTQIRNITEENRDTTQLTLGSLRYFIKDNGDILLDSFGNNGGHVVSYLFYQLEDWSNSERNGYFHKDNLQNIEKVSAIRDETYFLYLLILGSVKLSQEQLENLSESDN